MRAGSWPGFRLGTGRASSGRSWRSGGSTSSGSTLAAAHGKRRRAVTGDTRVPRRMNDGVSSAAVSPAVSSSWQEGSRAERWARLRAVERPSAGPCSRRRARREPASRMWPPSDPAQRSGRGSSGQVAQAGRRRPRDPGSARRTRMNPRPEPGVRGSWSSPSPSTSRRSSPSCRGARRTGRSTCRAGGPGPPGRPSRP